MTTRHGRVLVAPGIFRRGRVYDVRVSYKDRSGRRRRAWEAVHGGIREARAKLVQLKNQALDGNLVPKAEGKPLTMASFLADHFLPTSRSESLSTT
jgi:hypothetical protein